MEENHKKQSWIATFGTVATSDGELTYFPEVLKEGPQTEEHRFAIVKSNMPFDEGEVSFLVKLDESYAQCQLILNGDRETQIFVGLNSGGYRYVIQSWRNGKYEPLSLMGTAQNIQTGEWIPVQVSVSGSIIRLSIHDVMVCTAAFEIHPSPLQFFFSSKENIVVKDVQVRKQKPKAFVVMQFTEQFNELYEEVIRPTCESFGFDCVRGDDVYTNNQIVEDIIVSLKGSSVVIADITPDNPNVYYEVGYAHALSKPTILLSDKQRERLPFDVSGFRTIFYENSIGGKSAIEQRLRSHLENLGVQG